MKSSLSIAAAALLSASLAYEAHSSEFRRHTEAGYRFEGNTLIMPDGARQTGETKALREAYGLFGPDNHMLRTIFTTPGGQRYQVGYFMEGNTLRFPGNGKHQLVNASPEEAVAMLKETYGLVGDPSGPLVRTKW